MKFLCVFLFVLFSMQLSAQNTWDQMAFGLRMNRNDFFEENSILYKGKKSKHELGFGFGMIKSVFQQRINPELFYTLNTDYLILKKFSLQGVASYHVNCFNTNRMEREIHFFNEVLAGINLAYGSRLRFFVQPEAGLISESFHSDFLGKTKHALNFSYSAKIGVFYAF